MFQEFPYTDMHQLNLDWIIKIAKDFLDQYTHIQQLITDGETSLQTLTTEGLQQLQDKADNLEALLQQWYDTHSQDIADQLADALADLNEWYNTHQNYLDQALIDNTASFNAAAGAKGAEVIASIPADYTSTSQTLQEYLIDRTAGAIRPEFELGGLYYTNGDPEMHAAVNNKYVRNLLATPIHLDAGDVIVFPNRALRFFIVYYDYTNNVWVDTNWSYDVYTTITVSADYWISIQRRDTRIPDDINQLTNSVWFLHSNPNYITDRIELMDYWLHNDKIIPFFEKGSLTVYFNFVVESTTQEAYSVRTPILKPIFLHEGDIIINENPKTQFYLSYMGENANWFESNWYTTNIRVDHTGFYWICIRMFGHRTDETPDIEDIVRGFYIKYNHTIDNCYIPNYYFNQNYLPNKIAAINTATNYIKGTAFLFFTDTHFIPYNQLISKDLVKYALDNTTIPFSIFGGDIPGRTDTVAHLETDANIYTTYVNTIGKNRLYGMRGNHDIVLEAASGDVTGLSEGETYNKLYRGDDYLMVDGLPDHMCYTLVNHAQKIAYIVLNSKDIAGITGAAISPVQAQWMCDMLNKYGSYNIIMFSHITPCPDIPDHGGDVNGHSFIYHAIHRFQNKTAGNITLKNTAVSEIYPDQTIAVDFTNTTGKILLYVSGHTHADYSVTGQIAFITTTCDATLLDDGYNREPGTISEQAIDAYCVNIDDKKVDVIRIGAGTDRVVDLSEII